MRLGRDGPGPGRLARPPGHPAGTLSSPPPWSRVEGKSRVNLPQMPPLYGNLSKKPSICPWDASRARTLRAPARASSRYCLEPIRYNELLRRNVKRFRGGLVFKAHRLVHHSTLGSRVAKKKKIQQNQPVMTGIRSCLLHARGESHIF